MMKIMLTGLTALSILMLGACCSKQHLPAPVECVPEIITKTEYTPLDAWLTEPHVVPQPPSHGDNADLLEWCVVCAGANQQMSTQLRAIRELERE